MINSITSLIFISITGIVIGLTLAWVIINYIKNKKYNLLLQDNIRLNTENKQLLDNLSELKILRDKLQGELNDLNKSLASTKTELITSNKNYEDKISFIEQSQQQMQKNFEVVANEILESKSLRFTKTNEELLNPLKEQINKFRVEINQSQKENYGHGEKLLTEIGFLKNATEKINQDAVALTDALTGQNKTQGDWGENVLEMILESSGLKKDIEYRTQETYTSNNINSINANIRDIRRPDVIIYLPDNKQVIIDSKVSLTAYKEYYTNKDEDKIKQHIKSIKQHIRDLSSKEYHNIKQINSLDFTLMFIPIEGAFNLAMEYDKDLYNFGLERNIIIVNPTTTIAVLRVIKNMWGYYKQNKNAIEIADKAGRMFDQFVNFTESMDDIGDKLRRASKSYDTAYRRLNGQHGSLVKKAIQLQQLGAKTKKTLNIRLNNVDDNNISIPSNMLGDSEDIFSELDS